MSTDTPDERRTAMSACKGRKLTFPTRDAALVKANRGSGRLRPYRCKPCKGWHLTKQLRAGELGSRRGRP